MSIASTFKHPVALRKESVDRNKIRIATIDSISSVALRKESVDRNNVSANYHIRVRVALRKESVDRNFSAMQIVIIVVGRSPQGERG